MPAAIRHLAHWIKSDNPNASVAAFAKISLRHFGDRNVEGGRSGKVRVLSRSVPLRSSIAARTGSFGVLDRESNALDFVTWTRSWLRAAE
jgi:hypothetical protein